MKNVVLLVLYLFAGAAFILVLKGDLPPNQPIGDWLDPSEGFYYNARAAEYPPESAGSIPGLRGEVTVVRDDRGVPHIFAEHDLDAVSAMGYVLAQDRLFQMDFIPRVAAGKLAEVLGPSMIETDLFLRRTGMEWGARKNLERILDQAGIERDILQAYVRGVNAYIDELSYEDLPFEFKLLDYRPDRYTELHGVRVLQYMTFDLTYRSDDAIYQELVQALDAGDYEALYPRYASLFVPIIPEPGGLIQPQDKRPVFSTDVSPATAALMQAQYSKQVALAGTPFEGFVPGKGSNNWAVGPARSSTEAPILAGDMHLSLWLPAIWYEVHLKTPEMNVYGVTIPGAPLPVEGFNDRVGWAFTNTGSDQIDHMALTLDASGQKYLYKGEYLPLTETPDTVLVKGRAPVVDTLRYSHWGPVIAENGAAVSLRWVAHDSSRTVRAQWDMNHAASFDEFQQALRYWDTPMQNILYADLDGNIAIRSTGYLPVRKAGHGAGLLDGSSDAYEWIGRVPFDELPFSYNPDQQYLTSTNQQPADSTYPYYLGHDWRPGYRSLRIDALLSGKEIHSVEDLKRYQADVYVVQRDLFAPMLDSLSGVSDRAAEVRALLSRWEGEAGIDRPEPLVLDLYLDNLEKLVWDEPIFGGLQKPTEERLYALLTGGIDATWLDRVSTDEREDADQILKLALEATVDSLETHYGWDRANWRWGKNHNVVFRHFTRSEALRALWRGPFEYPGFASTLSPARDRQTTHSASWRMIVDFSTDPPTGYGVYPGGQSGNPFGLDYDRHIETYLKFGHYLLLKPDNASEMEQHQISSTLQLTQ